MVYLGARDRDPTCMDLAVLTAKNLQFNHAFRVGSWEPLTSAVIRRPRPNTTVTRRLAGSPLKLMS